MSSRLKIDLIGKRFGKWLVLSYGGAGHWLCKCDCGTIRKIWLGATKQGKPRSWGCVACSSREHFITHGLTNSRAYNIWQNMKSRCTNQNSHVYKFYGARGIRVCDRWMNSFEAFVQDMGLPPKGHSIERKNNNGNYEPENCVWATTIEQSANTRRNRYVTIGGETLHISEWARRYGINGTTVFARISKGWGEESAIITPVRVRK